MDAKNNGLLSSSIKMTLSGAYDANELVVTDDVLFSKEQQVRSVVLAFYDYYHLLINCTIEVQLEITNLNLTYNFGPEGKMVLLSFSPDILSLDINVHMAITLADDPMNYDLHNVELNCNGEVYPWTLEQGLNWIDQNFTVDAYEPYIEINFGETLYYG